jgi:hypothetical protein
MARAIESAKCPALLARIDGTSFVSGRCNTLFEGPLCGKDLLNEHNGPTAVVGGFCLANIVIGEDPDPNSYQQLWEEAQHISTFSKRLDEFSKEHQKQNREKNSN